MAETAPVTSAKINETFTQVSEARKILPALQNMKTAERHLTSGMQYLEYAGVATDDHNGAESLLSREAQEMTSRFKYLTKTALTTMLAEGSSFQDVVKVRESSEAERSALFDTFMIDGEAVEVVTTKSMNRFVNNENSTQAYNRQAVHVLLELKRTMKAHLVRQPYFWGFRASEFTALIEKNNAEADSVFRTGKRDELIMRYCGSISGVLRESRPYRETVEFSLDGVDYAAENLRPHDAQRLRGTFGEWMKYARQTGEVAEGA